MNVIELPGISFQKTNRPMGKFYTCRSCSQDFRINSPLYMSSSILDFSAGLDACRWNSFMASCPSDMSMLCSRVFLALHHQYTWKL